MKAFRLSASRVPVTNPFLVDGQVRGGRVLALLLAVAILSLLMIAPLLVTPVLHAVSQ